MYSYLFGDVVIFSPFQYQHFQNNNEMWKKLGSEHLQLLQIIVLANDVEVNIKHVINQ